MHLNLFEEQSKLFRGSLIQEKVKQTTFKVHKSAFKDKEWNLIIPIVDPEKVNWNQIEEIQQDTEKKYSLYLSENLNEKYKDHLSQKLYILNSIDCYIYNEISSKYKVDMQNNIFEQVTDKTFEAYIYEAKNAFMEWEGEEEYSKFFHNLGIRNEDKEYRTFIIRNKTNIISFGSLIYSKKLHLAYMHNAGTNNKFLRQGYFTKLKKLMLNYLLENGVNRVYALVEEYGGSYKALSKLGFKVVDKYYMYSK